MTNAEREEKVRLLAFNFLKRLEEYQQAGAVVKHWGDDFKPFFDEDGEKFGVELGEHCRSMYWPDDLTYKEMKQSLMDVDAVVYIPVNKKEKLYRLLEAKDIVKEVEKEMRK